MPNQITKFTAKLAKIAALAAVLAAGQSQAYTLLGQEPAANLIVNRAGLEWVYAAPCAGESPSCGVVQLSNGFGFASDAQWLASFSSISDLANAFNPASTVLCAATYFSTAHDHCDFSDTQSGWIWHSPLAPDATHSNDSLAETFLVRAADNGHVPEPASLALIAAAVAAGGAARRRKAG